ncbi:hypothetical protein BH09PSE1_BH09PSE1_00460 [soil metagenome]
MSRNSGFKGSGKNDVWFAVFCIAAVIVVSLFANARNTHAPDRPAPVPASALKE